MKAGTTKKKVSANAIARKEANSMSDKVNNPNDNMQVDEKKEPQSQIDEAWNSEYDLKKSSRDILVSSRRGCVESRETTHITPMSRRQKIKKKFQSIFDLSPFKREPQSDTETGNTPMKPHFRVHSEKAAINKPSALVGYLNWCFETSFLLYFISAAAIYMLIIAIFAFLLVAGADAGAFAGIDCIQNFMDDTFSHMYSSAFTLSWTTFSTVGYGQIYPAINLECSVLNMITSVESFVGVLYAGFCGAILFGKVQNVYSRATVIFSDVCVIVYGEGNEEDDDYNESDDYGHLLADEEIRRYSTKLKGIRGVHPHFQDDAKPVPFPVLLFRIVNERANNKRHGSIMNLDINAIGVLNPHTIHRGEEEVIGKVATCQYHPLTIQPSSVPLFDKIIFVKHDLDENSPLLTPFTRRLIRKNGGKWPEIINTAERIRMSIEFSHITISLEGISEVSKSTVYSQKTYTMDEIKIGWRFADMTYTTKTDSKTDYHVDLDLVNVVTEQMGGGGESLGNKPNLKSD